MISQMMPTSTDARGRLYGVTTGMSIPVIRWQVGPPMPKFADTVEIQSLNMHGGQAITLARIRSPMAQSSPKMEMAGTAIEDDDDRARLYDRARRGPPSPTDASPSCVMASIACTSLLSSRNGDVGPAIPFTPIPVTAVERRNRGRFIADTHRQCASRQCGSPSAPSAMEPVTCQTSRRKCWSRPPGPPPNPHTS